MHRLKLSSVAILSAISALSFTNVQAISASAEIVARDIKHDISEPVRNFPAETEVDRHSSPLHLVPLFHTPDHSINARAKAGPDTALQKLQSFNVPITVNTFTGIGVGLGNFTPDAVPPDPNGAPGLTQYVQWVNSSFAVFDKATGAVAAGFPKAGNSIWQGFGGLCETTNQGDPIVKYDQLADRWVLTQFAFSDPNTPPFLQCIAVSTTSDATGSYFRYAFQLNAFNDYGKLAVWPDAYYMSFNMFSGNNFNGPLACAFDRNAMLAGKSAAMQCHQLDSNNGTLLPADLDGKTSPMQGNPEYFMTFSSPNSLKLFKYHVDFTTPSNSIFTGPINIPVANFTIACLNQGGVCAPQPHTNTTLDTLSDRLMFRLPYRQFLNYSSMVATHTIKGKRGASAIRWYEIRFNNGSTVPTLHQQGTYNPDASSRFMGSIAMDKVGNIAVGYTISSSSIFPSVAVSARMPADVLGTLSNPTRLTTGSGSQTGVSRWGDYSSLAIDPVDDCTFWYTNEFLKTTGSFNWSTSISSFKLANCNA